MSSVGVGMKIFFIKACCARKRGTDEDTLRKKKLISRQKSFFYYIHGCRGLRVGASGGKAAKEGII
jgi:hypothetical protein